MKKVTFFISLLFAIAICSCNNCNHDLVKGITSKAKWHRFDSSLYSLNESKSFANKLDEVRSKDPIFYELYINKLFNINTKDSKALRIIFKHINSAQNQAIRKKIDSIYGDFSAIYGEVDLLARYYKFYYPNRSFPTIHTCYSGIAGFMAWIYNDTSILLDLDMYLGKDFEAYPQFFPAYKYNYFTKDYIAQNIGKELIRREYLVVEQNKPKNMLEMMLVEAAKIHDLKNMLPCRETYKLMEYTKEQWEWLEEEEALIWQYFAKENLLFESDYNLYKSLINEAPESLRPGVAQGAPPRIATFAGYKILEKVKKHLDSETAKEILMNYSAQEILNLAKYKP